MSQVNSGWWQKARKWLPGLLISLIAIAILLRVSDWQGVGDALGRVRWWTLAAGVGITLVFLLLRGAAWREILDGKPGLWQSFRIVNEGYLINNILFHRAGELARAVFMGQVNNIGTARALSSIVLERVFDLVFAAGIFLLCLPLVVGANWARTAGFITLGLVIVVLFALFLAARFQEKLLGWMDTWQIKVGFWQRWLKPQIRHLFEGLAVLNRPRRFLAAVLLIGLSWGVAFLNHFVFMRALIPDAPFWWGVFTDTALAMGIALPSVPSAVGVYEAAIVGALVLLGVASETGLAFAILLHVLQFVVTAILGMIGLIQDGRSLTQVKDIFSRREQEIS